MNKRACDFVEASQALHEGAFCAREWYHGQWSSLYALACFEYEAWTPEDVEGMISEAEGVLDEDTVDALKELLKLCQTTEG